MAMTRVVKFSAPMVRDIRDDLKRFAAGAAGNGFASTKINIGDGELGLPARFEQLLARWSNRRHVARKIGWI